ncbi:hypothetical protein HMPREF1401_00888 [Helicobacter pylori GAM120Ai]|uniref:Uncharacterized protein n=1 Tax=Helicobacter pylori GAM120Ai TaxID=1159029 RepID=A0AAV3IEW9_HELPX|nr:hypothetical protein HMPREF1401_00888 [Helicobacter pylori GAM120Ai]
MAWAVIASCFKPPTHIMFKPIAHQLPPFFRDKFRVKTPLTLFYFLNTLVFPAF